MKAACAAALIAAAVTVYGVDARPMHTGIDYARFLEERDAVDDELAQWMSKYQGDAAANGWLPATEARSADEVLEDRQQRFFLAKDLVKSLSEENPDAEFSTDSPFTLLTTEEFAKYVGNAYIGSAMDRRRVLRGQAPEPVEETGNAKVQPADLATAFANFFKKHSAAAGGGDKESWSFDGALESMKKVDWLSLFGWHGKHHKKQEAVTPAPTAAPEPETPAPTPEPETPAPEAVETPAPETEAPPPALTPGPAPEPAPAPEPVPADEDADIPAPEPVPETEAPAPVPEPETEAPAPVPAENESDVVDDQIGGEAQGYVDWSKSACMPPIQNQGQCGSCWSFATVAAVESTKCIVGKTGSYSKLSEQNIASCSTKNYGCNGGVPVWAMQYIIDNGVCSAQEDPYTSGNNRLAGCNQSCNKQKPGVTGIGRVQEEAGLLNALNKNPVVVAVASGNNAWKQYKGGVLSYCESSNVDHAVVVVGYDGATLKIRNSWGESWGENGYVRLARSTAGKGTCAVLTDMTYVQF